MKRHIIPFRPIYDAIQIILKHWNILFTSNWDWNTCVIGKASYDGFSYAMLDVIDKDQEQDGSKDSPLRDTTDDESKKWQIDRWPSTTAACFLSDKNE